MKKVFVMVAIVFILFLKGMDAYALVIPDFTSTVGNNDYILYKYKSTGIFELLVANHSNQNWNIPYNKILLCDSFARFEIENGRWVQKSWGYAGYNLDFSSSSEREYLYCSDDIYNYDGTLYMSKSGYPVPSVQVYVGSDRLVESSNTERNINYISGPGAIKFFWENQPDSDFSKRFKISAIRKTVFGESESDVDKIDTRNSDYLYNLSNPDTEYLYKLMVQDESSPYLVSDGFTSRTRYYYFKFNSLVSPKLSITGVVDGSTLMAVPDNVFVSKTDSTKKYTIWVNGRLVYTMSDYIREDYRIDSQFFDLGTNEIDIKDGDTAVKSIYFNVVPPGAGTGQPEPGNPDEYEPPPLDGSGKPTVPEGDEFSSWIYYYLQVIIYWLSLPFKMLANLLRDLKTGVIDELSTFINTYNSFFTATKNMFGFLPGQVWAVVSFGFGLSIFLWFFKGRRS